MWWRYNTEILQNMAPGISLDETICGEISHAMLHSLEVRVIKVLSIKETLWCGFFFFFDKWNISHLKWRNYPLEVKNCQIVSDLKHVHAFNQVIKMKWQLSVEVTQTCSRLTGAEHLSCPLCTFSTLLIYFKITHYFFSLTSTCSHEVEALKRWLYFSSFNKATHPQPQKCPATLNGPHPTKLMSVTTSMAGEHKC